ncbi:MAG: UDPglucose--hexose-phosphate uridylyltransferase [Acidimicrobiaceae bacterium]|jgi:UDPglucose--hexose-1-phosphate uridylyltransferase
MEVRTDPLTGAVVAVAASRQARPNQPVTGCPFCVGGLEAPEPYDVMAFPNRWPSFPDERCEVVLYAPEHDATFWSIGVDAALKVVDLWAERSAALGSRDDIAYVLVFENRGAAVGATIPHPHGQIYAYDAVPPAPADELARAEASGTCPLCAEDPGDRLVSESGGWRAWVPRASMYPYGLVVAPIDHEPDLPSLSSESRLGLAEVLVDVLHRLDGLWDAPMPYMLWFHQRPFAAGGWPMAHLHLEIAVPLRAPGVQRYVAAGELGSGLFVNPVVPEAAARALREVRW